MSAPKVAIIIQSIWGHVAELAKEAAEGAKKAGAQVDLYQFQETLPTEVLEKMHAYKAAFGTRYGRAPAQVSTFFDQTGGLWAKGALVGKFASVITSTGSQHGGAETTALTTIPWLVHHGINFVPIGYQFPELQEQSEIIGSSPYGAASIVAGDGSKRPSANDKSVATKQGTYFASVVGAFVRGKSTA